MARGFHDVGQFTAPDFDVVPDLRASHYRQPVAFAKRVLLGLGVAPRTNEHGARTWLLRTPEVVEDGVRNLLVDGLHQHWGLQRKPHGLQITGAPITLNPDLVFTGVDVTGDVKYKLPKKWDRRDVEQAVVFATGFKASRACVIHFELGDAGDGSSLPELTVGDLPVAPFAWNFGDDIDPQEAANTLIAEISAWLNGTYQTHQHQLPGFAGVA